MWRTGCERLEEKQACLAYKHFRVRRLHFVVQLATRNTTESKSQRKRRLEKVNVVRLSAFLCGALVLNFRLTNDLTDGTEAKD